MTILKNAHKMKIGAYEQRLINEYESKCGCGGKFTYYDLDMAGYKVGVCDCGRETCTDTNFFVVVHDTWRAGKQ